MDEIYYVLFSVGFYASVEEILAHEQELYYLYESHTERDY